MAHECTARRIPAGAVLVYLEVDVPEIAGAGFLTVSLETIRSTSSSPPPSQAEKIARSRLAALAKALWLPTAEKQSRAQVAAAIAALSAGARKEAFERQLAGIRELP